MGNKGSDTTTTNTAPNPEAMAAYQSLLNRAAGVASTPYQAYTGELTAGINPQQNLGIAGINQAANFASPYISQATQYATNLGRGPTQSDLSAYMNPYTQNVVDQTQAQFNRSNAAQQNDLRSRAAAQGALGGSRANVAAGDLAYQQQLGQAPVIAGLYNQGYQNALTGWQQGQSGAANMLGNLGVSGQGAALAGAGAQVGAGSLQQQTQQQYLNNLYNQFQIAQAFPYQQTQWLAGLQTGVGSQMGGTSTTTQPAPSLFGQILGGGLAAAGTAGKLGWAPFAKDGGRINGYADGGDVESGVAGSPFAGVGFIPGLNITHGAGAPPPPKPMGHEDPMASIKNGLAFSNGLDRKGSGVAGVPDWWSPAPREGDSNVWQGPPSASEVYRSGGVVKGYADGGAPEDDLSFEDRFAPAFAAEKSGEFIPDISSPNLSDLDVPDVMRPTPVKTLAYSGEGVAGVPPTSDGADMGFEPAPREGSPDVWQGAPSAVPSEKSGVAGWWPKKDSPAWDALITAGLGMMASRSPHPGVAIGQGGLQGMAAYTQAKEKAEDRAIRRQSLDMQARRLDEAAQRARETLALRTRALDEQVAYRDAMLDRGKFQNTGTTLPDGTPILMDGKTGKLYNGLTQEPLTAESKVVNPKARVPVTSITDENANLHGDDFLKTLSPNERNLVKGLAEYTVDPKTLSTMGGTREKYMNLALQYDPSFRQQRYNETYNAQTRFSSGPQGNTVRSFNVAIHHLGTLEEAATALKNGDIQKFNQLKNFIATETGHPEPTNFEGVRNIVAAEIVKGITGSGGGVEDRRKAEETVLKSGSPQQLLGMIGQYKKLMAGQMLGLKKQYEDATGLKNFDDKLMPETKRQLGIAAGAGHAPEAAAPAPAAGAKPKSVRQNGVTYDLQPDGSYKARP